ncbi:hypothetical protein V2J09_018612 [Rumex salicifolius]
MGSFKLISYGGYSSRCYSLPRASDKANYGSPSHSFCYLRGRSVNCGFRRSFDGRFSKLESFSEIFCSMRDSEEVLYENGEVGRERRDGRGKAESVIAAFLKGIPDENFSIVSACLIGLLTGIGVVVFNNAVHELRDFFWDGIPAHGASWLREKPIEVTWPRTVLVPVCGGVIVAFLNVLRDISEVPSPDLLTTRVKAVLRPFLKSVAACVTLGTGNSLGPEGPSVEIGSSIAKGVGTVLGRSEERKVSLMAAGSAAGISSGFNAAVAGCFFAVESVLWPSPSNSSTSLPNTTSMVILSAVIASVLAEVGLGSQPAFKVPVYDFRSPSELPLYLLLGILCGLVSLALSRCTTYMLHSVDKIQKDVGVPKVIFPVIGGLSIGLIALAYPEILYWGFENVDILIESRPFVKGLPADLLLQLVAIKIVATSLCRASGLVGGYYAPSLFIGAATGMAYGKFIALAVSQSHPIFSIVFVEVASPQAYALVGMAATLAGVCQVPLTAVLLLFELTQDYRIVLPLLGAVGMSSWITSSLTRKGLSDPNRPTNDTTSANEKDGSLASSDSLATGKADSNDLCEIESSLCLDMSDNINKELEKRIYVADAMRTKYATVLMSTLLIEAVTIMLAEKQSFAVITDDNNHLLGLISLTDVQEFSTSSVARNRRPEASLYAINILELIVAEMCSDGSKCNIPWTITPNVDIFTAQMLMVSHNLSQLPVVLDNISQSSRHPVGVLDMECIRLACRVFATKELLGKNCGVEELKD